MTRGGWGQGALGGGVGGRRSASGGRRHDACDDEDDGGRRFIPIDDRARGCDGSNPTPAREGWVGAGGRSTARQRRSEDERTLITTYKHRPIETNVVL